MTPYIIIGILLAVIVVLVAVLAWVIYAIDAGFQAWIDKMLWRR